jgi:hypothetical protein
LRYLSRPDVRELFNYVRWRSFSAVKLPLEWTGVLYSRFRRKETAESLQSAWEAGTVAPSPVHLFNLITANTALVPEINFDQPNWNVSTGDHEDFLRLHRWTYGPALARDSDLWLKLWSNWVQNNPPSAEAPQWESYSVAERIVNWCISLSLLRNAPIPLIRESLIQHARWLSSHLESREPHNHLINNARALFMFAAMWGHHALEDAAWNVLERELERQVLCDGMLGEQSVHYHLLLTRTYFEVVLIAGSIGRKIAPDFQARVQKMVSVASEFLREDGTIPCVGDVSPDCSTAYLAGVIGAAAKHFGIPSPTGNYFSESGFWILRKDGLHLVAHADPRGEVIRHGHDDALGVVLWVDGNEILADSGNPTYAPGPMLDYFRAAVAHNTVSIDGFPISPANERLKLFLRKDYFRRPVEMRQPRTDRFWSWTRIVHKGFTRLKHPVVVSRLITATPEYVWISDRLEGAGHHECEARWHFGLTDISQISDARWRLSCENRRQFDAIWLHDGHPSSARIIQEWRSSEYGRKQRSVGAAVSIGFHSTCRMDFLIWLGKMELKSFTLDQQDVLISSAEWTDRLENNGDSVNHVRNYRNL